MNIGLRTLVEAGRSLAAGPLDTPGLARSVFAAASTAIGLDPDALNAALGRLRAQSPDLAQAVEAELAQILTPRQQGELARIFLAQGTGADLIPDRGAGQPAPAADPSAAEPFITFSPGGVDHQTYVESLSRAPAGSEQAREYQALVRYAGTTDPVAVALVVGEVATNGVTNREAFARTGPLTGAELRYRIGADFAQIAAQARAEIVTLSDAIRNAEANGATPAGTAELRGLLQQSLNHFALVSENPGALRASGLVSDPIFSANLGVAEAYRSGADALAARSVPGADGAYSTVEAATRMRAVIGPEAYDRYIDGAISVASLPFIPADVTASADIRTNIVRQLGAGFFRHEIDVGGRFDNSLIGIGGTMTPERFTWQNTNLVMRQAMMDGVSRADRQALEWGQDAAVGRARYPAIVTEGAANLAGVFMGAGARLIQRPVVRALDEVADLRPATRMADEIAEAVPTTPPPVEAPVIDYFSDAMQVKLPHPYIPAATVRGLDPPLPNTKNHVHHIVELNGQPGKHRALVREAQDILRRYDIDPLTGPENLVNAPNRGHTIANARELTRELREAEAVGAPKEDIVAILSRYGELARER